jgi:uncharacterized membrane protein AbrB (regulator of aidB expression)
MKRFVDNFRPSRGTRHAMLLGAVLGVILAVTEASAPVIYGAMIASGTVLCVLEDKFPSWRLFRRDFWRRR